MIKNERDFLNYLSTPDDWELSGDTFNLQTKDKTIHFFLSDYLLTFPSIYINCWREIMNKHKATKANILGTYYNIKFESDESDKRLEYKDGYCDTSTKDIVIRNDFEDNINNLGDLESYQENVIRHEIIHAFLHESGLDSNCNWATEEAVDWFALQFYKITNAIDTVTMEYRQGGKAQDFDSCIAGSSPATPANSKKKG